MSSRNYPKAISATTAIPFDQPLTAIPPLTVVSNVTLTKVVTGAQVGFGASIRITADGVHTVNLSAFKRIGSGNWSNTNGQVNQLWFIYDGVDYCVCITQPATISGGAAAPVVVGMVATDANTISVTFDMSITGNDILGNNGFSFDNGSPLTITAISSPTSTVRTFTVSETMLSTDTITGSYDGTAGSALNGSGVELADFTDSSVTNSIAGGGGGSLSTSNRLGYWKETDMVAAGGEITSWPENTGNGADWVGIGVGGNPLDAGADGLEGNTSLNMALASALNLTSAFTIHAWVKRTGEAVLLAPSSGNGWYFYMNNTDTRTKPGAGNQQVNGSVVASGAWHVVSITYSGVDGDACKLYIDGVLTGSFSAVSITAGPFEIKKLLGPDAGLNWIGFMKRLAIYNEEQNGTLVGTNATALIA